MKSFSYVRPRTVEEAVKALAEGGTLKANGIDLVDRLKERVDEPDRVVSIADVAGLDRILEGIANDDPGVAVVTIGAMVTLSTLAGSAAIARHAPGVATAAGEAASPQLRNRATLGGNLAQHTRCGYYRHASFPCWKRGSEACPVLADGGVQETAAIFANASCASAHPSSLAPALAASGASVVVHGRGGGRSLPLSALYEAPKRGKRGDTVLSDDEVIVAVEVPSARRSAFVEVRRRAAFDWALVSCAAVIEEKDGKVSKARIFLGSVAPTPWRAKEAEAALLGKPWGPDSAAKAGEAAANGATPLPGNAYKVDLVKVVVRRALEAAHARS